MRLLTAILILTRAALTPVHAQNTPGPTLANVLKKGYVECAVAPTAPGFSFAATWAIQQARTVVDTLYHATGSVAVFEENPFERRLRDIHTVAQQAQGRQLHVETVGQIMLGMAPENVF